MPKSPKSKQDNQAIPPDYVQLKGSERHPSPRAKLLAAADPNEIFSVTIVLRRRPDGPPVPTFNYFAKTPLSQRRRMPLEEFAAKHGAAPEDMEKVVEFVRSHNLKIVKTHAARRTVVVSGTVAQMSQAFGVTLGRYQHDLRRHEGDFTRQQGRRIQAEIYRGRDGFIHVPKNLADIIVGVFGLDNRRITGTNGNAGDPANIGAVTIQQVTQLYNFPTPGPAISQQTIGVLSPSQGYGGYFQSDLELFFGAALPTVTPIAVDAGNGSIEVTTTVATTAGQNTLTFAATTGILVGSGVIIGPFLSQVGGLSPEASVMGVTTAGGSTTVTLGIFDYTTSTWSPAPVAATVPAGTNVYFNLDNETTQDICISASAAPGANVGVYFSTGDQAGWVDMINRAIHPDPGDFPAGVNPPSVLTCSFYISGGDDPYALADWQVSAAMLTAVDTVLQDAAIQGVTVCIASGDYGSNSVVGKYIESYTPLTYGGDGNAHVQYPASDPWVLAVGGTTLGGNVAGSPPPWVEFVWNDPDPGPPIVEWGTTGGGVSDFFPLPSYQSTANVPNSINLTADAGYPPFSKTGRGVPDVAANASYNSGYSGLYFAGSANWYYGNGTSAAAPLWAGLIAAINSNMDYNVGFVNPFFYALGSSGFNPINPLNPSLPQLAGCPTNNSNSGIAGYPAGAGWDACTGWGSPNGTALLAAIQDGLAQDLYFIVDQDVFGEAAVQAQLPGTAVFSAAFFVVVDGFTPNQLGITTGNLNNPPVKPTFTGWPSGMSYAFVSVQPADSSLLASSPNAAQRFTYIYNVVFTSTASFPSAATEVATYTIGAVVTATNSVSVSSAATFELLNSPAPYFAGGSGISWLSNDVRVFQLEPGVWTLPEPPYAPLNTGIVLQNTGNPTADATNFIQEVIQSFNSGSWPAPPNHPFDLIPDTGESAVDILPTDPTHGNNPVYNFAVARVRYDASAVNAQSVRAFFRLIPALSTSVAYDQTTNYRRWSNGVEFGDTIPLLGIDTSSGEVLTIPFFATPRIDASTVSMDSQTDNPNVQTIDATGTEVDAYFGCWLDINQTSQPQFPYSVPVGNPDGPYTGTLQTIQQLVTNQHQCIVAEIAFDPDPIAPGLSPSTSGPLAQRNLSLVPAANPGHPGSRSVPNTFTIRPTSVSLVSTELPDELMIDWGNTPAGSVASIYWPAVSAAEVLQLAARMYTTHSLTMSDSHTLKTPVGGITYVPIPSGSGASFAGLISVDLPLGIRKGQTFNVVVRQVTNVAQPRQDEKAVEKLPRWRRVLGSFQIGIPVETKQEMLAPEERLLSVLRWIQKTIPATSNWFLVFQRYVQQIAERVRDLGGNPGLILPSASGDGMQTSQSGKQHPHGGLEFTGKVVGLKFDRFGDFEGFFLRTEHGDERCFQSREHEIEELADRAWIERMVITVFVHHDDPHRPTSIVLRRAPFPIQG